MKIRIFALTATFLIAAAMIVTTVTMIAGCSKSNESRSAVIDNYSNRQAKLEQYNNLLKQASSNEKDGNMINALGYYWDAMEVLKSYEAEEAYLGYERIADAVKSGNPGLSIYDDASRKENWESLISDYDAYWKKNCACSFRFSKIEKSVQDKNISYIFIINNDYSEKYMSILSIVKTGYAKAYRNTWTSDTAWPQSLNADYQYTIEIKNSSDKTFETLSKLMTQSECIIEIKEPSKTFIQAIDAKDIIYDVSKVMLISPDKSISAVRSDNISSNSGYDINYYADRDAYTFVSNSLKIQNLKDKLMVPVRGSISIASFSMAKTETTQDLYTAVMGENPSTYNSKPAKGENQSERPVESVSWYDTIVFCNRLSILTGRAPCYKIDGNTDPDKWNYTPHSGEIISGNISCDFTVNGFRLPTENEWKYAANGGVNNDTFVYSGSNSLDNVGWYFGNSDDKTHQVGLKNPNSLGIYDLSGNVWEWCWDLYTSSYSNRVYRGGSANNLDFICELSNRHFNYSSRRYDNIGFRIVSTSLN